MQCQVIKVTPLPFDSIFVAGEQPYLGYWPDLKRWIQCEKKANDEWPHNSEQRWLWVGADGPLKGKPSHVMRLFEFEDNAVQLGIESVEV